VFTRRPLDLDAGAPVVLEPHCTLRASKTHFAANQLDANDDVRSKTAAILGRDLDDHRNSGFVSGLPQRLHFYPHGDRCGGIRSERTGHQ
jgi:hypothetical protein